MAAGKEICVYCGLSDPSTVDHVPPQGLFPPPRPSTLITVPCCETCNQRFAKDDEYFRAVVTSRVDVGNNAAVKQLLDKVYRGLARPQSTRFRKAFVAAAHEVDVFTPGGIYVGQSIQFDVDFGRLESTVARTVRGLYYSECLCRLPPECRITVYLDIGFADSIAAGDKTAVNLVERLSANPGTIIEPSVFAYWSQFPDRNSYMSVWLLLFYRQIWFLAFTDGRTAK
jgi:hypothetical protein